MTGQYPKDVMKCFGVLLLVWMTFEWSVTVFVLLCLGCLILPLVYYGLAAKLSKPLTEDDRRKQLKIELLKNVAYKPAKPQLISAPDNDVLFGQERRQKK